MCALFSTISLLHHYKYIDVVVVVAFAPVWEIQRWFFCLSFLFISFFICKLLAAILAVEHTHEYIRIGCGIFNVLYTRYCIHILCALCTLIAIYRSLNVIFFVKFFIFFALTLAYSCVCYTIFIKIDREIQKRKLKYEQE